MAPHSLSPFALPLIIASVRPQLVMCLRLGCLEVTVLWWKLILNQKQDQVQFLWQWVLKMLWRTTVAGIKVLWPCVFSSYQGKWVFIKVSVGFIRSRRTCICLIVLVAVQPVSGWFCHPWFTVTFVCLNECLSHVKFWWWQQSMITTMLSKMGGSRKKCSFINYLHFNYFFSYCFY